MRERVHGSPADGLAYAAWLSSRTPSAVVCSKREALSVMAPGDFFMAGDGTGIVAVFPSGEEAPYVPLSVDAAYMCGGPVGFGKKILPSELCRSSDSYWHMSALRVLRDVYSCAACIVADTGGSLSDEFLRLFGKLDASPLVYSIPEQRNLRAADPDFDVFPSEYTANIRSLLFSNAPTTAGCILSCASPAVETLDHHCFRSRERTVPAEGTVYVLSDTFGSAFSPALAAAVLGRPLVVSFDDEASEILECVLPRGGENVFVSMCAEMKRVETKSADRETFLRGNHERFARIVEESRTAMRSCRKMRVEEPPFLDFDERIVYSNGEFSLESGLLDFETPVENKAFSFSGDDDWLAEYRGKVAEPTCFQEYSDEMSGGGPTSTGGHVDSRRPEEKAPEETGPRSERHDERDDGYFLDAEF